MSVNTLIAMSCDCCAALRPDGRSRSQVESAMQTSLPKPTKSGQPRSNGVSYYYAVYGTASPVLTRRCPHRDVRSQPYQLRRAGRFSRRSTGPRPHALGDREISLSTWGKRPWLAC